MSENILFHSIRIICGCIKNGVADNKQAGSTNTTISYLYFSSNDYNKGWSRTREQSRLFLSRLAALSHLLNIVFSTVDKIHIVY